LALLIDYPSGEGAGLLLAYDDYYLHALAAAIGRGETAPCGSHGISVERRRKKVSFQMIFKNPSQAK
jgi:hypothetical protein